MADEIVTVVCARARGATRQTAVAMRRPDPKASVRRNPTKIVFGEDMARLEVEVPN